MKFFYREYKGIFFPCANSVQGFSSGWGALGQGYTCVGLILSVVCICIVHLFCRVIYHLFHPACCR